MSDIQLLGNRVLIEQSKAEDVSPGGIIIPEKVKEKPCVGTVVVTGEGKRCDDGKVYPMTVKRGNKILFIKHSGYKVKIGTKDYIVVDEDDVIGILLE